MTIHQAARAALSVNWEPETQETMVALAGCLTNYRPDAEGDSLLTYNRQWVELLQPYHVEGYLRFGLWQISLRDSTQFLSNATGTHDVGVQRSWLLVPENNAQAAAAMLRDHGPGYWHALIYQFFEPYLPEAQQALAELRESIKPPLANGPPAALYALPGVLRDFATKLEDYLNQPPWE